MSSMSEAKVERIPAAERREQILEAASLVFGERGYAGTTTDQIARAAGISQPYVVRLFGSKENLFVGALDRALERLMGAFREVVTTVRAEGGDQHQLEVRLGRAYLDLVEDRAILLILMQSFLLGRDPVIGVHARKCFLTVFRLFSDEAGFGVEEAREFMAYGMLLNTTLALGLPQEYYKEPIARSLLESLFRDKMEIVLKVTGTSE